MGNAESSETGATFVDVKIGVYSWGRGAGGQLSRIDELVPREIAAIDPKFDISTYRILSSNYQVVWDNAGKLFSIGGVLKGQSEEYKPKLVSEFEAKIVIDVAGSGNHSLFLLKEGEVYGVGSNAFGQAIGVMKDGNKTDILTPEQVLVCQATQDAKPEALTSVRTIACGVEFSAFITSANLCYSFGSNKAGKLGIGSDIDVFVTPCAVVGGLREEESIIAICCGENHCIALTGSDTNRGTVWTWGQGAFGQLGREEKTSSSTPTFVSIYISENFPQRFVEIKALACGSNFSAAISYGGDLFCWGGNGSGQCGVDSGEKVVYVPTRVLVPNLAEVGGRSRWVSVECGMRHVLAILEEGKFDAETKKMIWLRRQICSWGEGLSGKLGDNQRKKNRRRPYPITVFKTLQSPEGLETGIMSQIGCGSFSSWCVCIKKSDESGSDLS